MAYSTACYLDSDVGHAAPLAAQTVMPDILHSLLLAYDVARCISKHLRSPGGVPARRDPRRIVGPSRRRSGRGRHGGG